MNHLILLIVCFCIACSEHRQGDPEAVKALHDDYVRAWVHNDSSGVLKVFADDAVLLPQGHAPVQGKTEIRKYWWADNAQVTKITGLTESISNIVVDHDLAYLTGLSDVSWEVYEESKIVKARQSGVYTKIAKKNSEGQWRIILQMWYSLNS